MGVTQPQMRSPVVFMFSGQGSQYFQMGRELYEAGGIFAHWMTYLDGFLLDKFGRSILATLYGAHKKSDAFVDTLLSHPAIFMVEVALARELIGRGIRPDLTLGVSMGSFAAAVIAGCMRVEDALALVLRQACDFKGRCSQGGMIAVLASDHLHRQEPLRRHSVVASYNFDSHFVLSARAQHLTGIVDFLRASGATFQPLPVAFAYHSPWIEEAQSSFESAAQQVAVQPANIPLVCCAKSEVITDLPLGFFWDAVREPIRFRDTIAYLEAKGLHRYLDLGAAGTLATFLKYLLPANTRSTFNSILTPYGRDLDNLHSAVGALIGRQE